MEIVIWSDVDTREEGARERGRGPGGQVWVGLCAQHIYCTNGVIRRYNKAVTKRRCLCDPGASLYYNNGSRAWFGEEKRDAGSHKIWW